MGYRLPNFETHKKLTFLLRTLTNLRLSTAKLQSVQLRENPEFEIYHTAPPTTHPSIKHLRAAGSATFQGHQNNHSNSTPLSPFSLQS